MSRKHQVFVNRRAVRDVLQCLLDAKTARIGEAASAVIVMVFPRRETAMRQAAHAILLILADNLTRRRRHKDQGAVRRLERNGKSAREPLARLHQVGRCYPEILAFHPDIKLRGMFQIGGLHISNLPV